MTRHIRLRELAVEAGPNPQVVVDASGVLVMANQSSRELFKLGPADIGRPLSDLEVSYRPIDLRTPVDAVFKGRRSIALQHVEFAVADSTVRRFEAQVTPLLDEDGAVLGASVTFVDVTEVSQLRSELDRSKHDVETAYEELQSSNEELETTNEELQSTVEELETTNEELETTNEELETTNTELQAINADLRQRTEDINRLNVSLLAISGNIAVGAVVLNRDFKVQVWNEAAAEMWGLRSEEVLGQSIFTLDFGLPVGDIRAALNAVMRGNPAHKTLIVDAVTRRGRRIKCRVMASYLGSKRRGGGVVVLTEEVKEPK